LSDTGAMLGSAQTRLPRLASLRSWSLRWGACLRRRWIAMTSRS